MKRIHPTIEEIVSLPFFAPVEPSILQRLLGDAQIQFTRYERQEILYMADQRCSSIEIVMEGLLGVEQISEEGEVFAVAHFGPKAIVGGNLVFSSEQRYPHTIVALTDTRVLRMHRDGLFTILSTTPVVLVLFLQSISENTILVNDRLSLMVHQTLRKKLIRYLKSEMVRQGSREVSLPVSKTRLAQILGVSRTSVSRELSKMAKEGMISMSKRTIIVKEII